jgi:nucleotidyltransferase substrate binding protein (TIGR01987 family)
MILAYPFLKKIFALPFVQEVWLFGSRARGDGADSADMDLAFVCPEATAEDWQSLLSIVEEQNDTLVSVDAIRFDQLNPQEKLRENILKQKKILYQKGTSYMSKEFWKDAFEALGNAITRLGEVLEHPDLKNLEYLQDAAIQRFEFTVELYWKVLKKFLAHEKILAKTPREVLRQAYQAGLIQDEKFWLTMLDDHNQTSHAYQEDEAKRIFKNIQGYYPIFLKNYAELKIKWDSLVDE